MMPLMFLKGQIVLNFGALLQQTVVDCFLLISLKSKLPNQQLLYRKKPI